MKFCVDCDEVCKAAGNDGRYRCRKCAHRRRSHKYRKSEKGQKNCAEYYAKNKEIIIKRVAAWRVENPTKTKEHARKYKATDKAKASDRKYRSTARAKALKKAYYEDHKDEYRKRMRKHYQTNKDTYKARAKAYGKTENGKRLNREKRKRRYWNNPEYERLKATSTRYKLDKTILGGLFRKQSCCQLCNSKDNLTIDHIWPSVLGGTNKLTNLQILCKSCNSFKSSNILLPEGGILKSKYINAR